MDTNPTPDHDPTAADRKRDHITLALQSQVAQTDPRFYYEPLFSAHPERGSLPEFTFLDKPHRAPLWVSSMTGGTALARTINQNLARACGEFGFGMGLGSCRQLLYSDEYLADFDVRRLMGDSVPLFANLGIAQLELLIERKELDLIARLIEKLRADGLIIHVNPLQEWLQPEGDRFRQPPIQTIETVVEWASKRQISIIVKEVGQGFGLKSLEKLLEMPIAALDFAASGGTNFSKIELYRNDALAAKTYESVAQLGHTAAEMLEFTNQLVAKMGNRRQCPSLIISGGVRGFLDGFYLTQRSVLPAVYGQAAEFLRHAQSDYDALRQYVDLQIRGLELANAYLTLR